MTLPAVTYADYEAWGGTLGKDAFAKSIRAALASVREIIGFNEPRDDDDRDAYVRAVCAAVEVDQAYGATGGIGEGLASVTLGKFSASTGGSGLGAASAYQVDMSQAVRRELVGSSLLYQGIV